MADNSSLPVASGNETFANNDIGGVKYPRVKVTWGPAGTSNDADVATGKPLPIQVRSATGLIPIGEPTDAKSMATDTTSATLVSIAKQISASAQLIVTALGSTALDLGVGTAGTRTLRVAVDTSQTDGAEYEAVAASQTDQVMGATGAAGDFLSHVIVSPGTAGCGVVTIKDNATTLVAFPGGGTTALSNLIPFIIPVGILSTTGAWKITTGANVTCVAVGNFT